MIQIPLTQEQLVLLAPLLAQLTDANKRGENDALGAQVYPDGMVVSLISQDFVRRIQDAVYGTWLQGTDRTAEGSMADSIRPDATTIKYRAHRITWHASSEAVTAIKAYREQSGMSASATINALILDGSQSIIKS